MNIGTHCLLVVLVLIVSPLTPAAVTFSGDNFIDPPNHFVGLSGTGSMEINGGSAVNIQNLISVGYEGTGSVLVTDPGSSLTAAWTEIGRSGQGDVSIVNGGQFSVGDVHMGPLGGTGNLLVSDIGSSLSGGSLFVWGSSGSAQLSVDFGGSVETIGAQSYIGGAVTFDGTEYSGGTGSVWVNGQGSILDITANDFTIIGAGVSGFLRVWNEGAASLAGGPIYVGLAPNGFGQISVWDPGSSVTAYNDVFVGHNDGDGILEIEDGGRMVVNGNVSFSSRGTHAIKLSPSGTGSALQVFGDVNLNSDGGDGAELKLTLNHAPALGDEFTIIDNTGSNPINGQFRGLPEGTDLAATFGDQSFQFRVTYVGGAGNDVVATVVSPTCPDALKEYQRGKTDCVYRRGKKFTVEFSVPPGATDPKATLVDMNSKALLPVSVDIAGTKAKATFITSSDMPIGIYDARGTYLLDGATVETEAWSVYLIFETPQLAPSFDDASVKAFLYNEGPGGTKRDTQTYRLNWYGRLDAREDWIFVKANKPDANGNLKPQYRPRNWYEEAFDLGQYDDPRFFGMVINAANGETDPANVASKLMTAVSKVITYDKNDYNRSSTASGMFKNVSEQQFIDAANSDPENMDKELDGIVNGQCRDYAAALAAALRSIGIPARVATKIDRPDFIHHQWTEAYIGGAWTVYDAMDYGADSNSATGAYSTMAFPYGADAFEVVVGSALWSIDYVSSGIGNEGRFAIKETQANPVRVGFRALGGVTTDDALFEKCGDNPTGHDGKRYIAEDDQCPDVDPPDPELIAVSFDKTLYRPGDTVAAVATITNSDPVEQQVELKFRFFRIAGGDDGRTAFGDSVVGDPGTGVLGTTLQEMTESIVIPPGNVVTREFSMGIAAVEFPHDAYLVEASVTGAIGADKVIRSFNVAPAFDTQVAVNPPAPRVGDPLSFQLTVTNQTSNTITQVGATVQAPALYAADVQLDQSIPSLAPGAGHTFEWTLSPTLDDVPSLSSFTFFVTSDNGGTNQETINVILERPPTPSITLLESPTKAHEGNVFTLEYEVRNNGDTALLGTEATLVLPTGLTSVEAPIQSIGALAAGESTTVSWNVLAQSVGPQVIDLNVEDSAGFSDSRSLVIQVIEAPIPGDLDGDGDVDRDDLDIIKANLNNPATGPDDPMDINGDGMITVSDMRKLVLMCTRSRCATN